MAFLGSGTRILELIWGPLSDEFENNWDADENGSMSMESSFSASLDDEVNQESQSNIEDDVSDYHISLDEAGYVVSPSGCLILNSKYQEGGQPAFVKKNLPSCLNNALSPNECSICWCDLENPTTLRCGHRYCASCIDTYINLQTADFSNCQHFRSKLVPHNGALSLRCDIEYGTFCPNPKCAHIIDPVEMSKLSPSGHNRFDALSLASFLHKLEQIDEATRCPLQCGGWIQDCVCSNDKCRDRLVGLSESQKLQIRAKWKKAELSAGIMIKRWAVGRARHCPHCHLLIEKNLGCDHMLCRWCSKNFLWSQAKLSFE